MSTEFVSLRDAKARLSELAERAASGVDALIAKHGRPTARLTAPRPHRSRVDLAALRALTDAMPPQREGAGKAVRRLRESSRY